jgi:hypothetical protein
VAASAATSTTTVGWTFVSGFFASRPPQRCELISSGCHRAYGTPCVHELACSRCRFLRVDPAQVPRIEEMTCNAQARLAEAQDRAWLGEVAALEGVDVAGRDD